METQNTLFLKSEAVGCILQLLSFLPLINGNQIANLNNYSGRLEIAFMAMTAMLIIRGICLSTSSKIRKMPYPMTDGQIYLLGSLIKKKKN